MEVVVAGQHYAGVGRRLIAYAVDVGVLASGVMVSQFGLMLATGGFPFNLFQTGPQIEAWVLATVSLPSWLYFILQERSGSQATLGKRLLGMRVADTGGKRMGFGRALLRTAVKLFPWELTHLSLMLPVPIMWEESPGLRPGIILADLLIVIYIVTPLLTPRRQGVQDLAAGTIVLKARSIRP